MDFILKLSIGLAVTWLFYWLLLRRLTFYRWNRLFLLVYPAMAFLVPFIDINDLLPHREDGVWLQAIPVLNHYAFGTRPEEGVHAISASSMLWLVLAAGSLIMAARFCWQYWSLRKAVSGAVLLADDEAKLYHVNKRIMPFSFGRSIYLNKHLHSEEELQEILRHEFIHVKQRHSLDMLWGELICVLNWYNPFAWLLRNAIRQNLEFIADHQVLANGLDRKQYQYLLLKVTGINAFSMANNFNLSSLKKRIIMMNKKTSATVHLLRFVLVVPVLAILLLAFRGVTKADSGGPLSFSFTGTGIENSIAEASDTNGKDTTPVKLKIKERPKGVSFHLVDNKMTVKKKDGKPEHYDFNDAEQKKAFESKYGEMPLPPSPPPPPAKIKAAPGKPAAPPAPPTFKVTPGTPAAPVPPAPPAKLDEVTITAVGVKATPVKLKGVGELSEVSAPTKTIEIRRVGEIKEVPKEKSTSLVLRTTGDVDPLYVVDGEIIEKDKTLQELDPKAIESITVLKDKSAVAIYGEKGRNGVIVITTKAKAAAESQQNKNMLDDLCKLNALIIIDDKEYSCEEANKFLKENKEKIESVSVYKGADKVKAGTGKNANNAIVIRTSIK